YLKDYENYHYWGQKNSGCPIRDQNSYQSCCTLFNKEPSTSNQNNSASQKKDETIVYDEETKKRIHQTMHEIINNGMDYTSCLPLLKSNNETNNGYIQKCR